MKPLLTSLAVAALALTATADTVKIGVILPLTGNNAALGEMQLPAVELFRKEVAAGKFRHNYEVIVEDDQLTPRLTAVAANKLIAIDHVDAIMTFSSGTGYAVAPLAERKGIPHICLSSNMTLFKNQPHTFNHWISRASGVHSCADIIERLHGKRVAILSMREQGAVAYVPDLKKELASRSIDVVSEDFFNPDERDFRTTLAKIQEAHPDILIPLAQSPALEIILRQQKELGFNIPMPTIEVYDFTSAREFIEGQYYVSASKGTSDFVARLKALTGHDTAYCLPYTYDSLDFIRAAYEASPTVDHAAAAEFLAHLKDYPSAVGVVSTDENRFIDSPATYYKIDHGQIVPVTLDQIH